MHGINMVNMFTSNLERVLQLHTCNGSLLKYIGLQRKSAKVYRLSSGISEEAGSETDRRISVDFRESWCEQCACTVLINVLAPILPLNSNKMRFESHTIHINKVEFCIFLFIYLVAGIDVAIKFFYHHLALSLCLFLVAQKVILL